jgi:hypothetical protein
MTDTFSSPPVYVSGGANPTVTPDPVQISAGSNLCQFVNQDPNTNYIIELWIANNSTRVPLAIVLPKNQAIALILDPMAVANSTINYNVLVQGASNAPSRGGHGIVVGSGFGAGSSTAA